MGAVWLATDTLLHRQVAVKQVTSTTALSPEQAVEVRNRAMREGRIAARLSRNAPAPLPAPARAVLAGRIAVAVVLLAALPAFVSSVTDILTSA